MAIKWRQRLRPQRPIFAPRRRRLRRTLTAIVFVALAVMVVVALVWTVRRLGADTESRDGTVDHDHPPADVRSTP